MVCVRHYQRNTNAWEEAVCAENVHVYYTEDTAVPQQRDRIFEPVVYIRTIYRHQSRVRTHQVSLQVPTEHSPSIPEK
jgi:hypothetical protein